jgi:hypothetical protein
MIDVAATCRRIEPSFDPPSPFQIAKRATCRVWITAEPSDDLANLGSELDIPAGRDVNETTEHETSHRRHHWPDVEDVTYFHD